MTEYRDSGILDPEDLSVAGFGDLPIAEFTTPKLTTSRVPACKWGTPPQPCSLIVADAAGTIILDDSSGLGVSLREDVLAKN